MYCIAIILKELSYLVICRLSNPSKLQTVVLMKIFLWALLAGARKGEEIVCWTFLQTEIHCALKNSSGYLKLSYSCMDLKLFNMNLKYKNPMI